MVTKVNSVNRARKSMNERTRRECANSRKVRNLKRDEEFDENINEGRATHTWGITYKDKYNKTKQHVIDAPDAYDAKMKARRELGIKFSDIDDAEMIENLEEDTNGQNYMTVGKLLPKLVQTQNFVLVSAQNEADILFKGKVQGSVDNSVSNINVYYFGAWDDKTIAFYVDENDVEN